MTLGNPVLDKLYNVEAVGEVSPDVEVNPAHHELTRASHRKHDSYIEAMR